MMVAQNAGNQRHTLDSIEITGQSSFSNRDLEYKLKTLQLTLGYCRSVVEDRLPLGDEPSRHSIAQETFAKAKPLAIRLPFHMPKILTVETKLKQDTNQNSTKPLVSVTSATLPPNLQPIKVQRLVWMFETISCTAPIKYSDYSKPPIMQQTTLELKAALQSTANNIVAVIRKEEFAPNDDEIRAKLEQHKKVKDLCKFFEQQAKV